MSNCEGCNWRFSDNNDNEVDNENASKISCTKVQPYSIDEEVQEYEPCPVDCYLPYPVEYYNGDNIAEQENLEINEEDNTFKIDFTDPTMIEAQSFIQFHNTPDFVNTNANSSGIKEKFKCGVNSLNDLEGIEEIENLSDYIKLPGPEELEELLVMNQINVDYLGINRFLDFFIEDSRNYQDIEFKLKEILFTNDDDDDFIRKINNYSSIKDLGENLEDLKYIERKIMRFLGTNTNEFIDLLLFTFCITSANNFEHVIILTLSDFFC